MSTNLFSVGPQGSDRGSSSSSEFRPPYQWAADPAAVPLGKVCIEAPPKLIGNTAIYKFKIGQGNLRYSQLPYAEGDVSTQINILIQNLGTAAYEDIDYFALYENGLPDQAGHAGEHLVTDGTTAHWTPLDNGNPVQNIQIVIVEPDDMDQFIYRFQENTTILGYQIRCDSGAFDVAAQIDGVTITGLSQTTTSGFVTYAASGLNTAATGQELSIVITGSVTPSQGAIVITYQATVPPSDPVQNITVILPTPTNMVQFLYRFQGPATILGYQIQSDTGTFDVTAKLGATDITGLVANPTTNLFASYAASGANTASIYSELNLEITGVSAATNGKIVITYVPI